MRVLHCMDTTLTLLLSQCAAPPTAAKLSRHDQPDIPLLATTRAAPGNGTFVDLVLDPSPIPLVYPKRGVWKLLITACRNYKADIWVDACPPPAFPAAYVPTDPRLTALTVNCAPTLQPNLALPQPVIGFHAGRSADLTHTGMDTTATPPYGVFLTPAPVLAAFTVTSDGTTLSATFHSCAPLTNGTPYHLYDAYGLLLASGVLAVLGTTATFSTPLALQCADYYLFLGP